MESKGFQVSVYNRTTQKVDDFLAGRAKSKKIVGAHTIEELVSSLPAEENYDHGQGRICC